MVENVSVFFEKIIVDDYFIKLYEKMIQAYGKYLFGQSWKECFDKKEQKDILIYADMLACSASVNVDRKNFHQNIAQSIAIVMKTLFPDNEIFSVYELDIFKKTGNYLGEQKIKIEVSYDPEEEAFNSFLGDYLKMPGENNKRFFLPQKKIYDSLGANSFSFSAPTSMGKSLIAREYIKNCINSDDNKHINYAVVIPSKALINELKCGVIKDLGNSLQKKRYRVVSNMGDLSLEQKGLNYVFIMTPERLLYLLMEKPSILISYLFVDESHKLSTKGSRSTFYYQIIDILRKRDRNTKVIFASPNIPNPGLYLKTLCLDNLSTFYRTTFSPVSQLKFFINLEDKTVSSFNELTKDIKTVTVGDKGKKNEDTFVSIIKLLTFPTGKTEKKTLVYFGSKTDAFAYARLISKSLPTIKTEKRLTDLATEIREEIHNSYELADFIEKGVAVHVGYLPLSIRTRIEDYFKDGIIPILCCTSTLMEGVNLPADNLVVTTTKNGRSNLTPVEFKNLIGRVGRISYNLSGNVFMVSGLNKNKPNYLSYLTKEVPDQQLSVTELNSDAKKYIVGKLIEGKTDFSKYNVKQKAKEAATMRKFGLILLSSILKNRKGLVYREFEEYMTAEDENRIKNLFKKNEDKVDDNLDVSLDQTIELINAIRNEGLRYPDIDDYYGTLDFLERLSSIFKWEDYEKTTGLSVKSKYGWYAVILLQWMRGNGTRGIVEGALNYRAKPENRSKYGRENNPFDRNNPEDVNEEIGRVLDAINNIITFSLSNYFLCFSHEYKRLNGIDDMPNDWSEYVEYGSNDSVTIFLQKNGFSRESATYIRNSPMWKSCIIEEDGRMYLASKILECEKPCVALEVKEIKLNNPDLFVDG